MYKYFIACNVTFSFLLLRVVHKSLGRLNSKKNWQLFTTSILLVLSNFIKKIYWQWNLMKKVMIF